MGSTFLRSEQHLSHAGDLEEQQECGLCDEDVISDRLSEQTWKSLSSVEEDKLKLM